MKRTIVAPCVEANTQQSDRHKCMLESDPDDYVQPT